MLFGQAIHLFCTLSENLFRRYCRVILDISYKDFLSPNEYVQSEWKC